MVSMGHLSNKKPKIQNSMVKPNCIFLSDIDDFRLRENKFRMEHEHKSLRDEVAVLKMKTKAFALERSRSLAKVNITDNY